MEPAPLAVPLPSAASFANYLTLVDSDRRSLRSENKAAAASAAERRVPAPAIWKETGADGG